MPLAGLSDGYVAALGRFVAAGYNTGSGARPTLFKPSSSLYSDAAWLQINYDVAAPRLYLGAATGTLLAEFGYNTIYMTAPTTIATYTLSVDDDTVNQQLYAGPGQTDLIVDFNTAESAQFFTLGADGSLLCKAAAAQDEIQTVTQTGGATGGTYKLASASPAVTTGTIAWNANQAAVQTVFDTAFGGGKTTITGNAASFTCEFIGTLANQAVNLMTLDTNSLTGGTSPTVTIAHTTYGRAAPTNIFDVQTSAAAHILQVQPTKIGFFAATPVVQRSAYTQTYSTASRTVPALTSSAVVTTGAALASYGYTQAQADAIVTAINALRTDVSAIAQVCNSLIDDSQALGFAT